MTPIESIKNNMPDIPMVILTGARTNLSQPDSEFSEIKICASNLHISCVCTRGSISKIRPECTTCKNISEFDRYLLILDLQANPSHGVTPHV